MSEQIPRKGSRGRPRELSEVSGKSAFEPSRSMATLGSHRNRSMPSIRPDRALFGMRAFAAAHFAAQKRGFLRRKVPVEELISYSAEPLARPLMNLPRELNRDAARSFAIIQCFMRDLEGAMSDTDLFSEVLWLANQGIRHQLLRDEVFCQLAKQVTGHPSHDSAERGWVLMGVLFYAFRPSQLLFPHLEVFVESAQLESANLKRFLLLQLGRIKRTGSRTTPMTKEELRLALLVPRRPLVFGGSLKEIMQNPELVNAEGRLPRVLELLTAQITRLGGERTEGLFRVPGDADAVAMARLMIEAGQQTDFPNLRDPNVPASLLKEWLRDLADPLIPEVLYDQCIARSGDRKASLEILSALPEESYCVVDFLLRFLKHLLDPEIEKLTKMDSSNLALVFGPSFLRNPVSDLKDVFANSSAEQTFLLTLLESFQG
ncbi:RhoGAP-domain-containing protein [Linderina pennispora]|uniref:RhoGAP-domain-containing protein n=1 Tax=Linderina pennispora TaxID=61395 RepID=A0A1Y1W4U2_9FUNG|nr:RhoGAP-domain-containing protein [Linderina pennispora]ORX68573.1 RhoGAP-domain-containing protein [Linderina pennispora]